MRASAVVFLLALGAAACVPQPSPSPSSSAAPTPSPTVAPPSPSAALEGSVRLTVVNEDRMDRTMALVLVGRITDGEDHVIADLDLDVGGRALALPPGTYRFVGETHAFGPGGQGPVMARCARDFEVAAGGTTALTVHIDWGRPCFVEVS